MDSSGQVPAIVEFWYHYPIISLGAFNVKEKPLWSPRRICTSIALKVNGYINFEQGGCAMPGIVSIIRLRQSWAAILLLGLASCLVMHSSVAFADSKGKFPGKGSYQDWQRADSLYNEATNLLQSGNYDEAISKIQAAIAIYPFDSAYFHNLGVCYSKRKHQGDLSLAEEAHRSSISLDPCAGYWFSLANILYLEDRNKESLAALKTALNYSPPAQMAEQISEAIKRIESETH